jgi:tRNA-dihydrouridine synthase B
MIELGRLKINNSNILAPMSIFSDIGLRTICKEYGCGYTFTGLIYTSDFIKKNIIFSKKLDLFDKVGIQFITNSPKELKESLRIINKNEYYKGLKNITSIDLNLGCPEINIMKKGLGSSLLKDPILVRELFKVLRNGTDLPVSAKIRIAINTKHKKSKPYLRIAKIAEEEKLDFLTVHARTSGQKYEGDIDLEVLVELKKNINIPIIGNGGINSIEKANEMKLICDAIMIGQHAIKNPFFFHFLNNPDLKIDIYQEKINSIKKYIQLSKLYNIGFQHIKVHIINFLKDTKHKLAIIKINHSKNTEELKQHLKGII